MTCRSVSAHVGNLKNNDPSLIEDRDGTRRVYPHAVGNPVPTRAALATERPFAARTDFIRDRVYVTCDFALTVRNALA
jgi:hypothetical protein